MVKEEANPKGQKKEHDDFRNPKVNPQLFEKEDVTNKKGKHGRELDGR